MEVPEETRYFYFKNCYFFFLNLFHLFIGRTLKFRNYHPKDENLKKLMLPPQPDYISAMQARFEAVTKNEDNDVCFIELCTIMDIVNDMIFC